VKPYFDRVFSSKAAGYVSEVNLAEFYYKSAFRKGADVVDVWYRQIRQSAFKVISPDESITRNAALWKIKRNNLSLADCYALATADEKTAILLTTDSDLAEIREIKSVRFAL
jgi:predicted nucleic acid-binding protein